MSTPRPPIDEHSLKALFHDARSHNGWLERPVEDATLERLYELARWPPTSTNNQPMRLVFVKSPEAKQKLKPAIASGNVDKTMNAPVAIIVAYDTRFHEFMPRLLPPLASMYDTMPPEVREKMAHMNSTLQGGYLILAARALGLDCGPIGGFDAAQVNAAFFPDGRWKANFILNLGYGDPAKLRPRGPRFDFAEACRIE